MGIASDDTTIEPNVMRTVQDDGTSELTVSIDDEDHRFECWIDGDTAKVEHVETLSWRATVRTADPKEEVWRTLMQSEEFQTFIEEAEKIERVKG